MHNAFRIDELIAIAGSMETAVAEAERGSSRPIGSGCEPNPN